MPILTYSLDDPAARLPKVAGSKGAMLAKMRAAGLPTPTGFVVTTDAFALGGFAVPDHTTHELAALGPSDWEALDRHAGALRSAVTIAGIPDDVAAAIRTAHAQLGCPSVSVRSSATGEDLERASFAGLYDSFLNITSADDVVASVLDVWVSLFTTRAVSYRLLANIPNESVAMAVVVQELVDADASGVAFTRDPVSGSETHLWVNATFGLGEGLVSGATPADIFAVDKQTAAVTTRTVVDKHTKHSPKAGGGLASASVGGRRKRPSLTDPQLAELTRLIGRADGLFLGPKDVEFAVNDGRVSLLQMRPVTASGPPRPFQVTWDSPEEEEHGWLRDRGPVTKLQEGSLHVYNEHAKTCFDETGVPMARNHILKIADGYVFARGPNVEETEVQQRTEALERTDLQYIEAGALLYDAEIVPVVRQAIRDLRAFRWRSASPPQLHAHFLRALDAYGLVMGDLHWRMAGGFRPEWPKEFAALTGRPEVESGELLQAISNETTRLVGRLRRLARVVRDDATLSRIFAARDFPALDASALRDHPPLRQLNALLRRLLNKHGTRTGQGFGSATDFESPTWNMDPSQPLGLVASYAEQDTGALEASERRARRSRYAAIRRTRRRLAHDPERLGAFEWYLHWAKNNVRRMEDHNHFMEQGINGLFREAIHDLGVGLAREGRIGAPGDVFHLRLDELGSLATGESGDVRERIEQRKGEFAEQMLLHAPALIGHGPAPQRRRGQGGGPPPDAGLNGAVLRGVGASPGRAVGNAIVSMPSPTPPRVAPGDILVARNAGPDWTPIFPLLAGIVLDEGAVFQHAALVAREYGIPAVLMTQEATEVIMSGQRIAVDGTNAVVELYPD